MGGMGTIRDANDFIIYKENSTMTTNLLSASVRAGVTLFFYASSACVYPHSLQGSSELDVSLREDDVWKELPPQPQGLYGLEKLTSEFLLQAYAQKIQIRIARFHNIFGPRGAWFNGREKVPAAFVRKALAAQFLLPDSAPTMEIWGDGTQRRSFLFIEDCESRPVGVGSRNSNNVRVGSKLGWSPKVSLEEGVSITTHWMKEEMMKMLNGVSGSDRNTLLHRFQRSELVDLEKDGTTFAILLPVTSRGLETPEQCLDNLRTFAQSLIRTTWRDVQDVGSRYRLRVYLAIDDDDDFLQSKAENGEDVGTALLHAEGIRDVVTISCQVPRGHVCEIWRRCAERAWKEGCDYFVLMGDDVVVKDEGWMRDAEREFEAISNDEGVPYGFGVVAFTDISFPGMPTFPIVHRTHLNIFKGQVVPEVFVNQDGDPFLFQLYRRWGCSRMFESRLENKVGGGGKARYVQQHTKGWTFDTLDNATSKVEKWLSSFHPTVQRKLTVDVVIPCYRVQLPLLEPILALKSSPTCTVMFIIIIDNPKSHNIVELEAKYAHRPDVRIRINEKNMGASASRNRGMDESAAEWIHFLDDDVTPQSDLLVETEKVIRSHPKAAGFIGNAQFPPAESIFTNAVHLAGVTYFWDIATKMDEDLPWGVTANLIARRNVQDGVKYDLQFPKTGGGEDIDFCRKKREYSLEHGGEGFWPAPNVTVTHPYWNNGRRSYWRFYMWSKGDGGLIKMYPEDTYIDRAPNSAESLLIGIVLLAAGLILGFRTGSDILLGIAIKFLVAVLLANIVHDAYRHLWRDGERTKAIKSTVGNAKWVAAVLESSLIRMASEGGRLVGMLERGEVGQLGRRFDWFTGRLGQGPMEEERMNSRQRMMVAIGILAVLM
ncbi:glycosyltransferase family 2 protein [Jaapia argillacea MUCL 33604]|uniref:Glycosyltransferase family 2 protein n=1 Tax=Jaapia argillacea MUCL 33604 TaxID=933084 RepID=A0A067QNG4_9AGAM|nr:glycosyltransferase family 2 protein [Jaapia argillacea MUCL 33604]